MIVEGNRVIRVGWYGVAGENKVSESGVPLRPGIVIDSLFTKNMHNEFIIARPVCRVESSYYFYLCTYVLSTAIDKLKLCLKLKVPFSYI